MQNEAEQLVGSSAGKEADLESYEKEINSRIRKELFGDWFNLSGFIAFYVLILYFLFRAYGHQFHQPSLSRIALYIGIGFAVLLVIWIVIKICRINRSRYLVFYAMGLTPVVLLTVLQVPAEGIPYHAEYSYTFFYMNFSFYALVSGVYWHVPDRVKGVEKDRDYWVGWGLYRFAILLWLGLIVYFLTAFLVSFSREVRWEYLVYGIVNLAGLLCILGGVENYIRQKQQESRSENGYVQD